MEFAIIGFQRTGTGVLTALLNSSDQIYAAREIFHPDADGIESFAQFLHATSAGKPYRLADRAQIYGQYIDMLREKTGKPTIGVNVKYASCHHLDDDWRTLSGAPGLFGVLRNRGARIIHTVRRNLFEAAISNVYASATGVWHIDSNSTREYPRIAANPDKIIQIIQSYETELEHFNRHTADYPHLLVVEYEDLIEEAMFNPATLNKISAFLEVEGHLDPTPRLGRTRPPNLSQAICNVDALRRAVDDAGYGHLLN